MRTDAEWERFLFEKLPHPLNDDPSNELSRDTLDKAIIALAASKLWVVSVQPNPFGQVFTVSVVDAKAGIQVDNFLLNFSQAANAFLKTVGRARMEQGGR